MYKRQPSDSTGECWGIGAHKNGDCEIAEGTYKGEHLSKLWAEHPELFGNEDGKMCIRDRDYTEPFFMN